MMRGYRLCEVGRGHSRDNKYSALPIQVARCGTLMFSDILSTVYLCFMVIKIALYLILPGTSSQA